MVQCHSNRQLREAPNRRSVDVDRENQRSKEVHSQGWRNCAWRLWWERLRNLQFVHGRGSVKSFTFLRVSNIFFAISHTSFFRNSDKNLNLHTLMCALCTFIVTSGICSSIHSAWWIYHAAYVQPEDRLPIQCTRQQCYCNHARAFPVQARTSNKNIQSYRTFTRKKNYLRAVHFKFWTYDQRCVW